METNVGVNLLQNPLDVDGVGRLPPPSLLLLFSIVEVGVGWLGRILGWHDAAAANVLVN